MASNDFVPNTDVDLANFVAEIAKTIVSSEAMYGLLPADSNSLDDLVVVFQDAMTAHNAAQTMARVKSQDKQAARKVLVAQIRSLAKRIQAHPTVTDTQRAALGLTIPDKIPTAVSAPTTAPVLSIGTEQRLQHNVRFSDEATPNSMAKPTGAFGCDIYVKVGAVAPAGISECEYLGAATKSPTRFSFEDSQGGQTAWYFARWRTRSGLTGPLSALVSATIVK